METEEKSAVEGKKDKIQLPTSSFAIWRNKNRPLLAKLYPEMNNYDLNIKLLEKWQSMSIKEKRPFFEEAYEIECRYRGCPDGTTGIQKPRWMRNNNRDKFKKRPTKWSKYNRSLLMKEFPKLKATEINTKLREKWRSTNYAEKQPFADEAGEIKKPENSFMIWSKYNRSLLMKEFPKLKNTEISTKLGEKWRSMSDAEKQPFADEAEKMRRQHEEDHPGWNYRPKRKMDKFGPSEKSYIYVTKNSSGEYTTSDITDFFKQMISKQSVHCGKKSNPKAPTIGLLSDPSGSEAPAALFGPYTFPANILTSGGCVMAELPPVNTFQNLAGQSGYPAEVDVILYGKVETTEIKETHGELRILKINNQLL